MEKRIIMKQYLSKKIALIALIMLLPTTGMQASPWKWLALGTGIAWGTAAICETVKECNKRSCDREDRDLVAHFSHQIYTAADQHQMLVELTQQAKPKHAKEDFAAYFMSENRDFSATINKLKRDINDLDDSISRVENATYQWHHNPERDQLRIAAREELHKAKELYADLLSTRNKMDDIDSFVTLYVALHSLRTYDNPHDPFAHVNEAEYISQTCKQLSTIISAAEYDAHKTAEDERLIEKAYEKLGELKARKNALMRDPEYIRELQLKRQDELDQELLATKKRLARAEEEKAQAEQVRARAEEQKAREMREQNRLAAEANWIKERELSETKNKLDRIERRVRELQAEQDKDTLVIQLKTIFD